VKEYPRSFGEEGSHGHCHELLQRAGVSEGLVLDLGCAAGPLAEPVRALGADYVGADIDPNAVAALRERGFEGHVLDLAGDEDALVAALEGVVADRRLAAVLLLDVIEHLVDPVPLLRAVGRVERANPGMHLVVSIPNVTHTDMGIKLLLGRWDLSKIGLLDDTHVRFFNERLVTERLADGGWVEADAHDVVNPFSDQLFPADAPALRPGAPLRQAMWRIRMAASPGGETYQYVRRYAHDPEAALAVPRAPIYDGSPDDEERALLSVIVGRAGEAPEALGALLGDLAAQTTDDFEVVVGGGDGSPLPASQLAGLGVPVSVVAAPGEGDWRDAAVAAASGRYVSFLDGSARVAPTYVEAVRDAVDSLPGRVVQHGAAAAPAATLAERSRGAFAAVTADREPLRLEPLDLATTVPFGPLVLAAHAVPREACATNGLRFHPGDPEAAASLFLLRAVEMCGIVRISDCLAVVDEGAVRDLAKDVEFVSADLDRAPLVLPEGGGSQLLHMRTMIAALVPQRDELVAQIEELNEQVKVLSNLVRNRDAELTQTSAEARSLRSAVNRRVTTRVKRRLGGALRKL
jgi:2-polyprenyl-3-methyl-5-hydroxy-6-metoxy-1,4-benzoquinol methylase